MAVQKNLLSVKDMTPYIFIMWPSCLVGINLLMFR